MQVYTSCVWTKKVKPFSRLCFSCMQLSPQGSARDCLAWSNMWIVAVCMSGRTQVTCVHHTNEKQHFWKYIWKKKMFTSDSWIWLQWQIVTIAHISLFPFKFSCCDGAVSEWKARLSLLPWFNLWWFWQRLCKVGFPHKPVCLLNTFTLQQKEQLRAVQSVF